MLRERVEQGLAPLQELARIRDVEYVDLPTGHWPQFTRPEELARAILRSLSLIVPATPRAEPPLAGDETATLLGSLERQRATFAWKCSGLDAAGMQATVSVSSMTLGGLVKHLALVEDVSFSRRLLGRDLQSLWETADFDDPDWEWHSAADDTPEQLLRLWQDAVARSRAAVAEVLADGDLGQLARVSPWVEPPSLRRTLVDLIEEYARHVGHADLIREAVDGLTGEDPPAGPPPSDS